MGILKKRKYQQDGSIFGDSRFIDFTPEIALPQRGGNQGTRSSSPGVGDGSKKTTATKEADADMKNLLPSDIEFYNRRKAQIMKAIEDGFTKDPDGFGSSAEYNSFREELYKMEGEYYPKMFNMSKVYMANRTNYDSKSVKAGDEAAIVDGKAFVQFTEKAGEDLKGRFALVGKQDLLTNPEYFDLLTGRQVVDLRQKHPEFSGFTTLGTEADKLLARSYSSTMFQDEINNALTGVGVTEGDADYYHNNRFLDIKSMQFDKDDLLIKSNAKNLVSVLEGLKDTNSNLLEYVENNAIRTLFKKVKNGELDPASFQNEDYLTETIGRAMTTTIARKLSSNLKATQEDINKAAGKSGEDKVIHSNVFRDAMITLLKKSKGVEFSNLNRTDPSTGSIIATLPAADISKGQMIFNIYKEGTGKTDADKDATETNRKTINNNIYIREVMGSSSLITTSSGIEISKLADKKDLSQVVIEDNSPFILVLAPTEEDPDNPGKIRVNYKNKYVPELLKATKSAYAKLAKDNIKPEDVLKSGSPDLRKKLENLIKEEFMANIKDETVEKIPIMRMALAFRVMYEANGDTYIDPTKKRSPEWSEEPITDVWVPSEDDQLYDKIGDHSWVSHPQETYAFIPLSDAFWTQTQLDKTFPSEFLSETTKGKQSSAYSSDNNMGVLNFENILKNENIRLYYENKQKQSKKYGGKLLSSEELSNLLFK